MAKGKAKSPLSAKEERCVGHVKKKGHSKISSIKICRKGGKNR